MHKLAAPLAFALALGLPADSAAQMTAGPTLAWHDDADIGVGITVGGSADGIAEGAGWLGDFIWFFPGNDVDYFEINAHATFDFATGSSTLFPFILAGPQLARASSTGGGQTDFGFNIGGGIDIDTGRFRPTVGARFEIGGGEGFVIFATLPFQGGS